MATGYCVKCKKPHEMASPYLEKKNNRYLLKGKCQKTGIKMTKFVGKEEASKYESFATGDTKRQLKYDAGKIEKATVPEPPVYSPPPTAPVWQPEPVVAEAPKVEEKEPETVEEPEDTKKPMTPAEAEVMEATDWEEPDEPIEAEEKESEEVAEEFAAEDEKEPEEEFDEEEELVEAESPQPFPHEPGTGEPQPRYPFPKLDRDMLLTVGGLAALFSIPFIIKAIGKKEQPKQ